METIIKNGANGNTLVVDNKGRAHTFTIEETQYQEATELGYAFNINTGLINITSESALLYFKSNEEDTFVVGSFEVGLQAGTGVAGTKPEVTVIRNPSLGTIVSGASNVAIKQNLNFGSSNTLDSVNYKGASGNTFTNGDACVYIFQNFESRVALDIDYDLTKGSSFGIKINPNLASGSVNVFVAITGYIKKK